MVAWGSNFRGALGDGTLLERSTPVPVSGLPPVQAIVPGAALTHDGAVYAWGGQLPPADAADLEAQMPIGVSKLGGCPDLPPDVPWPSRDARPMAFIAQVKLGDVALLDRDRALPPAGLLSFFTLPIDWAEGSEAGRVIYTEPQTPLTRTPLPAGLPADERFAPVRVEPERDVTGVPRESADLAPLGLSWEQTLAYAHAARQPGRDESPMHHMLGHPQIIQNDPRDSHGDLCLLLQVDSDRALAMVWGDLGRLCYWLDPKSLQERRFDRCLFDYQA